MLTFHGLMPDSLFGHNMVINLDKGLKNLLNYVMLQKCIFNSHENFIKDLSR